jgi:glycosyltransferase involved in cell wall biosynthesis
LNIGRLSEQKGQLLLVEAAARLRDLGRSFEVAIIGGGPLEEAVTERIRQLRLEAVVKLLGWKSGAEVREELIASRALVLPSFAEGLPVVIMEALALGRAVISTYVAGIPELVRPGESGWLVPAGSVEELSQAMGEALDASHEELARMGCLGRERVVAEHDVRVEAKRLLDRINQVGAPE